jgi:hypothetical protein
MKKAFLNIIPLLQVSKPDKSLISQLLRTSIEIAKIVLGQG